MQRIDGHLVLSPTDLTKHVACAHITTLDLDALDHGDRPGIAADDSLNLVFTKGLEHERAYLAQLREQGRVVEDIAQLGLRGPAAEQATLAAMRRGVDVVYQATFFDGHWLGLADFLLRVDLPDGERSLLGPWRYDIADTKLARRLKVPALLQMATYAARLETLQGVPPQWLTVVTGDKEAHPWRLVDVAPYARRRRAELLDAIDHPAPTESIRVQHCGQCRWKERCAAEWLDRDDLIQVAGMRASHRARLVEAGITTMTSLAEATREAVDSALAGSARATRERLHQQARLQIEERRTNQPRYELVPPEPLPDEREPGSTVPALRGFELLPEPDEGDVYLDFEGDPWAEDGAGREYLAGVCDRSREFTAFWAHDFDQEASLTADLLDWLSARAKQFPNMHVYHYAPYETTALKRLTGQHGTREHDLDELLRGERFVDLYAVVRQGMRISKGSYSIKKLEAFYWDGTRQADGDAVADGLSSVVEYEEYLTGLADGCPDQSILDRIRDYNKLDVLSTLDLHDWLEGRRQELVAQGHSLRRPGIKAEKPIGDDELEEIDLTERLVQAGHGLLAGCVGWHRREARPDWWDYFRYQHLETADLFEDATALALPRDPQAVGTIRRSTIWRYRFDPQDCKPPVSRGKKQKTYVQSVDEPRENIGWVDAYDPAEGWIDIVMASSKTPIVPRALAGPGPLGDKDLRASLRRTGMARLAGASNLATRLLDGVVPDAESLRARPGESPADVVVRVGARLSGEVLAVQGPPGAGKTWAGARMIRALVDSGLKVGVTALSHKVIEHLLHQVDRPAVHKVSASDGEAVRVTGQVREQTDVAAVVDELDSGAVRLVGGTAWLWSREDLVGKVDVLVIDEAGQFALANAVAVAPAATSMVLLGDPQQLTQPTKATHPYGSGISVLEHLIGEHDVIEADRGVFLDRTYRMHPALTEFVSELAYDRQLRSADGRDRIDLSAPGPLSGVGLRWVPVDHHHEAAQDSAEEAAVVAVLVADLLHGSWTDAEGVTKPIRLDDVLVVAPYNAHVSALMKALPQGAKVGTVDKFQGQQGAVVIYSMASTSAAVAPRGVSFLYDLHRLNVAVSRAKAMAVVVGSPLLMDAAVHTPEELRAVNALCRFVDEAKLV